MTKPSERIAIIGGGISGLYCAYVLGLKGHEVFLFEKSARVGGRICTVRLKSSADTEVPGVEELKRGEVDQASPAVNCPTSLPSQAETEKQKQTENERKKGSLADLEFYAEFGPMRVELDKQILLRGLFSHLCIKEDVRNLRDRDEPALTEFPSYASPGAINDPKYQLRPNEEGRSPIQLLSLALLRIMLELTVIREDGSDVLKEARDTLIGRVQLAAATGEEVLPVFITWVKKLKPEQLFAIQCYGTLRGAPLCGLGFWNLLSDFLSHDAISKIRDLGTFYHLLPENPNAAEWLTWWLNGLSISDNLQGVFGGMYSLVEGLIAKVEGGRKSGEICVTIECNHEARQLLRTDQRGRFDIKFENGKTSRDFDRVIIALPKVPLQKFARASLDALSSEAEIEGLLSCALDFPMVKTFVVVKDRWWGNERMANRYATRVPTRELHYWPARLSDRYGMIMFYTDRPATAFWANYVPPGPQNDVSSRGRSEEKLSDETEGRLLDKIVQYLNESNALDLNREDILWYGIRDWGREPYGAANHVWRPERRYWIVMARLGQIGEARIHICGEAYSDYHGFIEGALRSAAYAIHRIEHDGKLTDFNWLKEYHLLASAQEAEKGGNSSAKSFNISSDGDRKRRKEKESREDIEYLGSLESWAGQLDGFRQYKELSYLATEALVRTAK